jgi:hypothetical protein
MAPKTPPSFLLDRFNVRLPDGMRERLAEAAKANNRSLNSEIVARLEASLDAGSADGSFAKLHQSLEDLKASLEKAIKKKAV